ncbi:MAG: hypothetical protein GWN84_27120 [Gammaproteobacteria bacterium]|nr:hypothetical protein [Gammaproteobacteria bacterium]NIR86006.1 hypothetical protein [Gammaproteobacteria bacterium]NIU07248.1 hypothetical protein [Gammaproteobacteria bacterium]NIV54053.1 hypothetical protein [Gammaproteobacteria bacterium]NIX88521.1 hypothetical protein [Gammaproteobacteria bacterium]
MMGEYFESDGGLGSYYGTAYDQASANGGPPAPTAPLGAYFPYQAPLQGVGQSASVTPLATTAGVIWLFSRALGGFLVGRALAPDREARGTYGWVGALVGTFTGPVGLGVMGIVSMEERD